MYSAVISAINHPDAINPYQAVFNHRMIKALAEADISLDVVSPRPYAPPVGPYSEYGDIPKIETWGRYDVHHPRFWYLLPKRVFYGISGESFANQVTAYIEQNFDPPDVIHGCHIYPDGYGLIPYASQHDLPLFVTAHGTLLNSFQNHPRSVRRKIRQTLHEAARVLCVSNKLAEKAGRFTDSSKVRTVPIGADPDKYPINQQSRLRDELDIPINTTVVLFVGQFTRQKGISEIIEVIPRLKAEETVFVFVGAKGKMEPELRRAVAKSEFSSQYIYSGLPPFALRRLYAIADLLLLPSHSEGRPTVIYEAMASKTAVLASDVGGVSEQVTHDETGRLIPPGDVNSLITELESLTSDRNRLRRLGERGRKRLREQNWTWTNHSDRIQKLHLAAIDN